MKSLIALIILICVGIFITGALVGHDIGRYKEQKKIDLPEEHPLISTDPARPDTMIAFYKEGKLTFRFLTATRNYPQFNH